MDGITHQSFALDFGSLEALIKPKSIAVVGASSDPTRIGGRPIAYMLKNKYAGQIFPVNPHRDEVQGIPAFASIDMLPTGIDVAIIAIKAEHVLATIVALGKKKLKSIIIFSSGFSEIGDGGIALQQSIMTEAQRWKMRILGPNSLGVFNSTLGYYANFASGIENSTPLPGRVGIASQSGAYGAHLFGVAIERGLGTPIFVATGNEVDVCVGDVIGWMAQSDDVDVIMAYIESINHAERFIAALAIAHSLRKPVILQCVGDSVLGKKAALSHTAALSGNRTLINALLADYAVLCVDSCDALLDTAYAATHKNFPVDNTFGIVTISGGAGIIASDLAEKLQLPMPPMPQAAQNKLKKQVSFCSPLNPVDCTAHILNDLSLVGTFTETMIVDGGYKSIMAYFSQSGTVPSVKPKLVAEFHKLKKKYPERLFVLSLIAPLKYGQEYKAAGLLVFEEPTVGVRVIHSMGQLGAAFARPLRHQPERTLLLLPNTTPNEWEAKRLLAQVGMMMVPEAVFDTGLAAGDYADHIGYPVVLKIVSPDIMHKSDVGGVLMDIHNHTDVVKGHHLLIKNIQQRLPEAKIDGVLVAKQIVGGVECFMGIQKDPDLGTFVAFGLGGIFVEILEDVVFRRCPVDVIEATEMIHSIKGLPLLMGGRGREPVDIPALAEQLSRLSWFGWNAGDAINSVDLNPVLALPVGMGCYVADAVIEINEEVWNEP